MIQTLIAAMPLGKKSSLTVKSLRQVPAPAGGVASRVFSLVKDLAIAAMRSGEAGISDEAMASWSPLRSRPAPMRRRLEQAGA